MRIYAYLRASTKEQDAKRAKSAVTKFARDAGHKISGWFIENESGAKLKRPELFRLLELAESGDVLLVEQVDRISRLNSTDWETLKTMIVSKGIRIVALDLPTSHQFIQSAGDDFTKRMLAAINAMLLDMLAAVARKDYEDRQRRQAEGIAKAKKEGRYKGRPMDVRQRENIASHLRAGKSYSEIQRLLKCGRDTIAAVKKELARSGQL